MSKQAVTVTLTIDTHDGPEIDPRIVVDTLIGFTPAGNPWWVPDAELVSDPDAPKYPTIDLGEAERLQPGYNVEVELRNGDSFDATFLGSHYGTYSLQPLDSVNDEPEGNVREISEHDIARINVY